MQLCCTNMSFSVVNAALLLKLILSTFLHSPTSGLTVTWSRPRVYKDDGDYKGFSHTYDQYVNSYLRVYFDACSNDFTKYSDLKLGWRITDNTETEVFWKETSSCKINWRAPKEGNYSLEVTVFDGEQAFETKTLPVRVRDIWMVVMGDSYIAGYGLPIENCKLPFKPRPKYIREDEWPSFPIGCARSPKSFGVQTYERIAKKYPHLGIQFSFVACSGARVADMWGNDGDSDMEKLVKSLLLFPPLKSLADAFFNLIPSQFPQLTRIIDIHEQLLKKCKGCNASPDLILLNIGGNDLFVPVMGATVATGIPGLSWLEQRRMPYFLKNMEKLLDELDHRFDDAGINPKTVFYPIGFGNLENENGELKSCYKMGLANDWDFRNLQKSFVEPFDRSLIRKCKDFNWSALDVNAAYKKHGVCSKNSHFLWWDNSLKSDCHTFTAFHPNEKGHSATAEVMWPVIEKYLENELGITRS